MFINFLTMMLTVLASGLLLLALYALYVKNAKDAVAWSVPFGIIGFLGMVFGLRIVMTWPLPGSYNIAFGEMMVLYSSLFLGASWAMATEKKLKPLGYLAGTFGVIAIVIGERIFELKMTKAPFFSGGGFALVGLSGVTIFLYMMFKKKMIKALAIVLLLLSAVFWYYMTYESYRGHMETYASWKPLTMVTTSNEK